MKKYLRKLAAFTLAAFTSFTSMASFPVFANEIQEEYALKIQVQGDGEVKLADEQNAIETNFQNVYPKGKKIDLTFVSKSEPLESVKVNQQNVKITDNKYSFILEKDTEIKVVFHKQENEPKSKADESVVPESVVPASKNNENIKTQSKNEDSQNDEFINNYSEIMSNYNKQATNDYPTSTFAMYATSGNSISEQAQKENKLGIEHLKSHS